MPEPVAGVPDPLSDFIKEGAWDVSDVLAPMVDEFKEENGIE